LQVTNRRLGNNEKCDCFRSETPKVVPINKSKNKANKRKPKKPSIKPAKVEKLVPIARKNTADKRRPKAPPQKPAKVVYNPIIENRYYYNADTQVRVTYIEWFGSRGVNLHTGYTKHLCIALL
jgi:hypothetical protein